MIRVAIFVIMLLPSIVWADPAGPYLSLGPQLTYLEASQTNAGFVMDFNTGFGASGAYGLVGKDAWRWFRGETEVTYRYNKIDTDTLFNMSRLKFSGRMESISLLANGYYDFKPYGEDGTMPFVGAGVGGTWLRMSIDDGGSQEDWVLGYQFILGVSFAIGDYDRFDVQYRYFGTQTPDFEGFEVDYHTHSLLFVLRVGL